MIRVAILDDYQNVSLEMADWSPLAGRAAITVFNDHLSNLDKVVERLLPFVQRQGKVRHIGLSEVSVAQLAAVRRLASVVSVQNRYNLIDRRADEVLDYCTREDIGFIPWFPLATGNLARPGGPLARAAEQLGAQPAQVAIAWLLRKSPVILPIPGTSKVKHLEENTASALLPLSDEIMEDLEKGAATR
jgi:pyridoxine 4-dehydrogenase